MSDSATITSSILAGDYCRVLAFTFLIYDHILTSPQEVKYIWQKRKTFSSFCFMFNRYFAFLANTVAMVLSFIPLSDEKICRRYNLFHQIALISTQVCVCILLTLRIYALYNRSMRVLSYMVCSGAVLLGISCWSLFSQKSTSTQISDGCHLGLTEITAIHLAAAWEALFCYDCILFGLTLYQSYVTYPGPRTSSSSNRRPPRPGPPSILAVVLRDGAIYFAIMALCNLANIITFYFSESFFKGGLSTFASCISVTMMSRLMLNLHQSAPVGIFSTTTGALYDDDHYISSIVFTSRGEPSSVSGFDLSFSHSYNDTDVSVREEDVELAGSQGGSAIPDSGRLRQHDGAVSFEDHRGGMADEAQMGLHRHDDQHEFDVRDGGMWEDRPRRGGRGGPGHRISVYRGRPTVRIRT